MWANEFPSSPDLGTPIRDRVDEFGQWLLTDVSDLTTSIQTGFTERFLNPVQSLLAESPWFVTAAAITLIAMIVGGVRALLFTVVCLAGIYYLDLWNFAMVTLTLGARGDGAVVVARPSSSGSGWDAAGRSTA